MHGPNTLNEQVKQRRQKKRVTFAIELQLLFSTEDVVMESANGRIEQQ